MNEPIQLWTHHESGFCIDAHDLAIDHTLGANWSYNARNFRYREVVPILWKMVGTQNFLWCCTQRGQFQRMTSEHDLVEWELNISASQVVAFYREAQWEDIVWSRTDDWTGLIIPAADCGADVGALVRVPLPVGSAVVHQMVPRYTGRLAGDP